MSETKLFTAFFNRKNRISLIKAISMPLLLRKQRQTGKASHISVYSVIVTFLLNILLNTFDF